MNKLMLNNTARNHIKFFPMAGVFDDIPTTEKEQILWCKDQFKQLQHSVNVKRLVIYKSRAKGYQISVWEFNNRYYLIENIRNEFKTYNSTIYISKDKDDMLNIAKFLHQNVESIMADYRQQILDARDALLREKSKAPIEAEPLDIKAPIEATIDTDADTDA